MAMGYFYATGVKISLARGKLKHLKLGALGVHKPPTRQGI